ncbi:SE1832 family protein [Jeotgalibacillus sp. ET6]|uniref:SE1832 family protein n=1 Tax=Jeotgalibacillus sp. ET6 TaxID=3037260 RepID=UPI0024184F26|nr:SE1832 family protein [Jeotgalibacillus sp. ET6]MDG5472793.1 SE1832 family protein [Jeotgalibacillus sp. ET6]
MSHSQAAEQRIEELKQEYIRAQDQLEKLESLGMDAGSAERKLVRIETELEQLRKEET